MNVLVKEFISSLVFSVRLGFLLWLFVGPLSSEEDAQVAAFADLAGVQFAVSVLAVGCKLHAAALVVAVFAEAPRVVLLRDVLACCHSFWSDPFVVLFCSHLWNEARLASPRWLLLFLRLASLNCLL